MATEVTQIKRQREEEIYEEPKRQKTQNQILSILEQDENEEVNQDLSDIFTTFEQELSCESITNFDQYSSPDKQHATSPDCSPYEEHDSYNVMRHLLEASDDELGLPNIMERGDDEINRPAFPFPLSTGLWEFEDETANYYAMLQSELFM